MLIIRRSLPLLLVAACGSETTPRKTEVVPDTRVSPLECQSYMTAKHQRLKAQATGWAITDATAMRYEASLEHKFDAANPAASFDGHYRAGIDGTGLDAHPGCTTGGLYYGAGAASPDDPIWSSLFQLGDEAAGKVWRDSKGHFKCAAKVYDGVEDTAKPVVLLIQGNSIRPHTWEKFTATADFNCIACSEYGAEIDAAPRDQLAEKLVARGYKTIAVDKRADMITSQFGQMGEALNSMDCANDPNNNCAHNMDHGWATPIVQNFVEAALLEYSGERKLSFVAHSMGVPTLRDALRRIYLRYAEASDSWSINPFAHIKDVILLSGANHGVGNYDGSPAGGGHRYCDEYEHMKGKIVCEMGSRASYTQTYHAAPLNGPEGLFETPCADGDYAFGETEACGGNVVEYTTLVMKDLEGGTQQDKYVSEHASKLLNDGCAKNEVLGLEHFDTSGYLLGVNHFGTQRTDAAHDFIFERLED